MAVTLSFNLTDAEEARIIEIAGMVAPDATPAQIKAWAERHAKIGLREIVMRVYNEYKDAQLESDWPVDMTPPPPEDPNKHLS